MTAKYIGKKAKVSKKDKEKLLANLEKEMREAAKGAGLRTVRQSFAISCWS